MRVALVVLTVSAILPDPARAEYVHSYSQWRAMNETAQSFYATGLVDGIVMMGGDKATAARSDGLQNCLNELQISGTMIAEAITRRYERNTVDWDRAPSIMFALEFLDGICRKYVDDEKFQSP